MARPNRDGWDVLDDWEGEVFYFTPGHETYNDYYRLEVRQIFVNAVQWVAAKA